MCPDLEKLRSDVALLAGMPRYFRAACATIGYLRDAWAQYWREHVFGGEFMRSGVEVVHLTFYLVYSFLRHWLASTAGINVPPHTRSHSTVAWTGASQGSLTRALLPCGASSSLSSLLDVNKCGPALSVLIAFCLCSPGLGACGLQGLPGCQPTAWAIFMHTHDNPLLHSSMTPPHSKSPSPPSLSLMMCTRMISSTAICSLKLSSQSKWRHPTASATEKHVRTFTYWTTNKLVAHSRCYALRNIAHSVMHMLSVPCEERYPPQRGECSTNVEMTWKSSIYSVSVINNHAGPKV